jgi:acyl carrier protein
MAQHVDVIALFTQAALEVDNRKLSNLNKDTVITTLGMDSVAVMELVSFFEEKLSVRIPDEELNRIRTVGDLRDALAKLVPAGTTVI